MLRILIAVLKLCICILKGIDKWFHEKGIDRATQTDVSMIVPEGNVPKAVPEGNIPKAVPVPMANPAPTRVGAAKAKSTAKAKADLANKPCWVPNCPKCESPMRLKAAHRGGMFYGCTTYPDCNGSRPPNYFEVQGAKEE